MNSTTAPTTPFTIPRGTPPAARTVLRLLQKLRHGTLTLQLPDGSMQRFGKADDLPHATLNLHNWKVCAAALKSGDIGFAESFIAGDWSTPNLVDLLRVLVREQGRVVTREQLMKEIWDTTWFGSTKTLDMHISVLRKKLGDDVAQPRHISTVRGLGFRFERPDSPVELG